MNKKVINFAKAAKGLIATEKKNFTRRGKGSDKEDVSPTVRYYEALQDKLGKIKCQGKEWFIYQPKEGIWKLRKEETLFPDVIKVLAPGDRNSKKAAELLKYAWMASQTDEKMYGAIRYDKDLNYFLIKCPDEILKIDARSGRLIEGPKFHSKYNFTSSLAVNYNPNATCSLFLQTLRQIQPDKADRILLMNFASLALVPHSKHECAMICIGEGGNGKSVIWDAITGVLGEENITHITLSDICHNNRKHVHRLRRSMFNVSTETDSRKILESTSLKLVISGEILPFDRIYQEGGEMQTNCKLCFLTNNMPTFANGSEAEPRRFKFIHFGQTFDEDNRNVNLREQLKIEREGIFKLMISRLPKVLGQMDLGQGSRASKLIQSKFAIRNNLVKAFVDHCFDPLPPPGSYELKDCMWYAYKRYAEDNDIQIGFDLDQKDEFFKRLYQYKPELSQGGNPRKLINGMQKPIIKNVKLVVTHL